jgi:hypothetical protein
MSNNNYISALVSSGEWDNEPGVQERVQKAAEAVAARHGMRINQKPDLVLTENPGQYKLAWRDAR